MARFDTTSEKESWNTDNEWSFKEVAYVDGQIIVHLFNKQEFNGRQERLQQGQSSQETKTEIT
jgi:hypothetical protein